MIFNSPIKAALLSVLLLGFLLPIGMLDSVSSALYLTIFILHLISLSFASTLAVFKIGSVVKSADWSCRILFLITFTLVLSAVIPSAILPVTARDALIHHLAIPKLWIENGSIFPTSWHVWSFYPMIIQLSFTALLQILPEQYCTLYVLLFLPLTTLIVAKISSLLSQQKSAQIFSCIIFLSIPVVLKLSSIPLVDLPLVFFCGAGIYYLLKLQNEQNITNSVLYAGFSWGLALSCKLNAIPAFALALLIFIAPSLKVQKSKFFVVRQYFIVSVIAVLCFSPWLIKNWLWAGNPVYPYLSSIFGQHVPVFESGLKGLNPLQQRLLLYGESPLQLLSLPIRIFLEGQDENPRLFDGKLSILLLAGLFFGALKLKDPKIRQLVFYSFAFLLFALFSMSARVRYLTPVLVSLSVLSGSAFAVLESKKWAWISRLVLAIQLAISFQYVINTFPISEAYAYTTGKLSKTKYLEANIPEYPIIEFCNSELPKDARISLIYTGNQFYLYQRQVYSAGHTSADQVLEWLHNSKSFEELAVKVKASGLNYFVIEDSRLQAVMMTALSDQEKEIWNSFRVNLLSPLISARGFTLYKIQ